MLDGQPRLAHPTRPDDRDRPRRPCHLREVFELGVAPEDRRQRGCQVVTISRQHAQRRERVLQACAVHLPELDRIVEVADPIPAERPQRQVRRQVNTVGSVRRDHDLATVTGVDDARRLVHGERHVITLVRDRNARMDTHPDAHGCLRGPGLCTQSELSRSAGDDRVGRAVEHDEERVTFGVDLVAAVALPLLAEDLAVTVERGCVSVAETADEARRTFDVGEHERDGARWQPGSPSNHFHSLPLLVSRQKQMRRRAAARVLERMANCETRRVGVN